jgi:ribosomal protein S18 acetylase RimI-like enzyme
MVSNASPARSTDDDPVTGAPIAIRPMTPADIAAVVALQIAFLEGSIVTELGPAFLARFHGLALQQPATLAFVACDGAGAIVGFVVASLDVHAFDGYVKPRVLPALALALLLPRRWPLLWSVARGVADAAPQPDVPAELLLLVVDSRVRRRRIGQRLLVELETMLGARAVTRYRVAVRSHLEVARAFYRALGFEPEQELTVLGRPMTYLTKRVAIDTNTKDDAH